MLSKMYKITALLVLVGVAALFTVSTAAAQGAGPNVKYKKETRYDFDDDVVEGELQRPDGELIDTVRKAKHSSLIKIRKDFFPEMLKSAEDI